MKRIRLALGGLALGILGVVLTASVSTTPTTQAAGWDGPAIYPGVPWTCQRSETPPHQRVCTYYWPF